MTALFVAILMVVTGFAVSHESDGAPAEPLPALLQQPDYAAPAVDPMPDAFQEIPCGDACDECGPLIVQDSFWYAGTDVLATRFTHVAYQTNWEELSVGVRPYIGWENSSGVGFRVRWWLFEADGETNISYHYLYYLTDADSIYANAIAERVTFSAANLDFDFYRRFYYDRTDCVLGVGTKAISIDANYGTYFTEEVGAGGIGAFAEGRHPLYRGRTFRCAFLGYGRFGLLTGEMENRYGSMEPYEFELNMSTAEIGIGLEMARTFQRWHFVFQLVSEVQRWELSGSGARDLSFDALGLRVGGQW
jgi:hypothetical protein